MTDSLVSNEQARKEVNGWLDLKKVRAKKREQYSEIIDSLVEGVEEGFLKIDENGLMTQVLTFPIGTDNKITELTYALRANAGEIDEWTKGVPSGNGEARILAVAAGLTRKANVNGGVAKETLKKMESTDTPLMQAAMVFYMG